MKELEFMELLGDLPAEYIDAASNPRQKKRRFAWLRYGVPAMAACIAVVIFAAVYPRLKSPEIPSVETQPAVTEITVTGASEAEAVTTAAPETDENGKIQNPPHTQTDAKGETHTLTESEAENEQENNLSGTAQEGQSGEHHSQPDPPQEGTEKTKPHVTTSKNGVTRQTTKATTKAGSAGTAKSTTKAPARTTKAPARTTVNATTRPAARTTATTRKTTQASSVNYTSAAMTYATRPMDMTQAAATPTTAPQHGGDTQPNYTNPIADPPDIETGGQKGTGDPNGSDEPTPTDLPREVYKWQTYNPDPRSDELDVWYEITGGYPGGDEYREIEDFDFDNYNCLIIHLRTHATDADLTEISLDGRTLQVSGMIYRQEFDPTQRHFMFAFAIPKSIDWLDSDPEINWDLTGEASSFYMTTEGEPYFWYY